MEGLKFEYEGTTYNVPCMPNKYWREKLLYYGDCPARLVDCQDSMCYCCIYHRGNQKARKAFYYKCFPEERAQEILEEVAAAVPDPKPSKKLPKLTQEVFNRPDCPEWAQYAAVDSDGRAFWYEYKPVSDGYEWVWGCMFDFGFASIPGNFDSSDWENSVIERPYSSSYKILTETNLVALEHNVKELMKQGWIPRGGAVKNDYSYMQTMVKR